MKEIIYSNTMTSKEKIERLESEFAELALAEFALDGPHIEVNSKFRKDWTLLGMAADRGDIDVAGYLLEKGALIEQGNEWGQTPLHLAARAGNLEMVQFLVKNGAAINAVTTDDSYNSVSGGTPGKASALVLAAMNGHFQIVDFLLACNPKTAQEQIYLALQMIENVKLVIFGSPFETWDDAGAYEGGLYVRREEIRDQQIKKIKNEKKFKADCNEAVLALKANGLRKNYHLGFSPAFKMKYKADAAIRLLVNDQIRHDDIFCKILDFVIEAPSVPKKSK